MAHSEEPPRHSPTASSLRSQSLRDAFVDLHGPRLHGFALLLTLGDRRRSAGLASAALASAQIRLAELRHPERGAAWLRASVFRAASRHRYKAIADPMALSELGVTAAASRGLSVLTLAERVALIATVIERLDGRDVATVLGRDGRRLEVLVQRALRRYLGAAARASTDLSVPPGPIRRRVAATAARTLG